MNDHAEPPKPNIDVAVAHTKPPGTLSFDPELFIHHLESWEGSDEEKAEYLELVWQIVVQFVDLGFGIHPLSAAMQKSCGQLPQDPSSKDFQALDVVNWEKQSNREATTNVGAQVRQKERSHVPGG